MLAEDGSQICPTYKLTAAAMDAFLLENTGLTLAQTNKVDLDAFDYLPDYDAYYLTKGDTNYRSVTFTSGQREGSYIRLYWKDFYYGGETNECVTLLDRGDGQYWFVSHLLLDGDVPSAFAYPDEEPWMTLPLSGLTPYQPQKTTLTRHSMDCDQRGAGFIIDGTDGGEYSIRIYRSTDGNVYAAVMQSEAVGRNGMCGMGGRRIFHRPRRWTSGTDADEYRLFFFHDLLGHSGFTVSYLDYLTGGPGRGGYIGTVTDYYYLDNSGTPYLLARAKGDAQLIDLNGDGVIGAVRRLRRFRAVLLPAGQPVLRSRRQGSFAGRLAGNELLESRQLGSQLPPPDRSAALCPCPNGPRRSIPSPTPISPAISTTGMGNC